MTPALLAVLLAGQPAAEPTAAKARAFLEAHCFRCHGKDGKRSGGFGYALDAKQLVAKGVFVPGKPGEGAMLRVTSAEPSEMMPPPEVKERPSAAEVADLKKWIEAGAPPFDAAPPVPKAKARAPLSDLDVYRAMAEHLRKQAPRQARYKRFITLTPLYNDPAVSDRTLRLYHAAVSKLLNSLSWRRGLVLPRIVDAGGAVLCFDLRDLDWDRRDAWRLLVARDDTQKLAGYPYALSHENAPDDADLNRLANEVYTLAGTRLPAVRADWFIATAAKPPLYHDLLGLPKTAGELEKRLGIDVAANFRRDYLVRAGLSLSGVAAKANRLLERHEGTTGGYWKSYDFASSAGRGDLKRHPLGPIDLFPEGRHPFAEAAFKHDGGEMIFPLPNGLQAYFLVNGAGKRIDRGPDIVRDDKETAGEGTVIVNGLSCMACHKHGMIRDGVKDGVRLGAGLEGDELEKVRRLYPRQEEIDRLLKEDSAAFLRALDRACGPYLKRAEDEKKKIEAFPEPVSALATPYLKSNLDLAQAARELGLSPADLKAKIEADPRLGNRLALKGLAAGDTIKRETWESTTDEGESVFQAAAAILKRGAARKERRR